MDAIRLYLDHDVDPELADRLSERGYDVVATRDVLGSHSQRSDADQLEYAAANWRAILGHNRRDLKREHIARLARGEEHWGVITSGRMSLDELETLVLRLLLTVSRMQARNMYVRLHHFRSLRP